MKTKSAGFTLLEIMIVVSIIGLLATIAIPSFISSRETTHKQLCIENQRIIGDMLTLYCLDHGKAPLTDNFANITVIRDALVPINPDDRYIKNRKPFDCPASGDGSENDYNLAVLDGMIIGFECKILIDHNE